MCLDIEHFLKVMLIKAVENNSTKGTGEDGYKIVTDFIFDTHQTSLKERTSVSSKRVSSVSRKISQNTQNPYCKGLIDSYSDEMPIWAFVELISFGDLEDLIEYYSNLTDWKAPIDNKSLDRVRQIRNAAAHNNCIINDLRSTNQNSKTPKFITDFVSKANVSSNSRKKKLSNKRINQIVHLLYIYDKVVKSENTRKIRLDELNKLMNERIVQHREYFSTNSLLTSTYDFFKKIIDKISMKD